MSTVPLAPAPFFLHIYAKPGSYQNKIGDWITQQGIHLLKVYITAPPEAGKANQAIIGLLAQTLGTTKSTITLVRGVASRRKIFKIESWSHTWAQKLPKPLLPTLFPL